MASSVLYIAMEVNTNSTITAIATSSLQAYQTTVFIVLLLGEFLASLVGNVILIAMIVKTRKFQNTINVFLTGFELSYLCSMSIMITTVTTLAYGEWMLGSIMCLLQKQVLAIVVLATPVVHLFLSKEILSMALAPCEYKTSIKRVALNIAFTWLITVASLSIMEALYFDAEEDGNWPYNLCTPFIITNRENEAIVFAYSIIVTAGIGVVLAITMKNYCRVVHPGGLETLSHTNGLLAETDNIAFDKERVKAILPAFVVQFICTIAACIWGNFMILYDMVSGLEEESRPLFEYPFICIAVLPAVSPIIFMFSSSKYRKHVSELCPCFARPLRVFTTVALQYRIPVATRSNRIYQSNIQPTSARDSFDNTDDLEQVDIDREGTAYWPNTRRPKKAWSDNDSID